MNFSLSIWLSDTEEIRKRQRFLQFLRSIPQSRSDEQTIIEWRVGKWTELHSSSNIRPLPPDDSLTVIADALRNETSTDLVFQVDFLWDLWPHSLPQFGTIEDPEPKPVDVRYYSSDVPFAHGHNDNGSFTCAEFDGDIYWSIDEAMIAPHPWLFDSKVDPDQKLWPVRVGRFVEFVRNTILLLTPSHAILTNEVVLSGAIPACVVFHRQPVEFIRDLVRALVLMRDALCAWENPNPEVLYMGRALREPEKSLSVQRIWEIGSQCRRSLEELSARVDIFSDSRVCEQILQLCDHPHRLLSAIDDHKSSKIVDFLKQSPSATLDQIQEGYILTSERMGNGQLREVYEELSRAVIAGRF